MSPYANFFNSQLRLLRRILPSFSFRSSNIKIRSDWEMLSLDSRVTDFFSLSLPLPESAPLSRHFRHPPPWYGSDLTVKTKRAGIFRRRARFPEESSWKRDQRDRGRWASSQKDTCENLVVLCNVIWSPHLFADRVDRSLWDMNDNIHCQVRWDISHFLFPKIPNYLTKSNLLIFNSFRWDGDNDVTNRVEENAVLHLSLSAWIWIAPLFLHWDRNTASVSS